MRDEIDTQAELEKSILCGSAIRPNDTVERREGICSRTARKWLNRLGYKLKDVQKEVFFLWAQIKRCGRVLGNFFKRDKVTSTLLCQV